MLNTHSLPQARKVGGEELPGHSDSDQSENEPMDQDESLHEGSDNSQSEEGEEWAGIEGTTTVSQENYEQGGGKPNKPPIGEELRVIKDAADLFRSSSFKLQVRPLIRLFQLSLMWTTSPD